MTDTGRRRIYKVAVLETRPSKSLDGTTVDGLLDRWRAEAIDAGQHPDRWLADVVDRRSPVPSVDIDEVVGEVVAELQQQRSTWTRRDVIRAAARRAPFDVGDADRARRWVEAVADGVLAHRVVLGLAGPVPGAPSVLRRRDGMSQYEHHGAPRYTTSATVAVEQQVLDIVTAGRSAGRAVADEHAVADAVNAAGLGADQAAAVRAVALDGDTVACVIGPAGAGKSRMMGAAATAWAASRIPVRGLAVSATAAGVLAAETGMRADTVAKFLYEQDRPGGPRPGWRPLRGEVLVVDEASMVASADLARLVVLAEATRGKVVLVGDWAQLGAVEAGGLFRLLANDRPAELTDIRRFHAAWEQAASVRLRARDPAVIAVYEQLGRVTSGGRDAMIDEAFDRWQTARAAGESIVLCAADWTTVDALAGRCRAARVAAGEVEPDGITAGEHVVGVGDEIVTCRNDRRLVTTADGWVRNGDRWRVLARHDDGALTVDDESGRGRLTLPAGYVAEHVTLGYAVTIHKAQGVTVDHALVLVDDTTTAEGLYVAMTRGRHTNTALVVTDGDTPDHGPAPPPMAAADVLGQALRRISAERTAIEELREQLAASESLAVLNPRLASVNAWIHQHAPPDRTAELDRLDTRRQSIAALRVSRLSKDGRALRKVARDLDQHAEQLHGRQQHRLDWLDQHADVFAYRGQLETAVTERRRDLGRQALDTQPEHLVRLLGPVPTGDISRGIQWAHRAASIEAYREEWGIDPDQLTTSPIDGVQYREWEAAGFRGLDLARRLETPLPERTLDRGLGIEL